MRQRFTYDCVLIKEDDGYCASFPQIPGAFADGDTREEAIAHATEALMAFLADDLNNGLTPAGYERSAEVVALSVEIDHEDAREAACRTFKDAALDLKVSAPRITALVKAGKLDVELVDGLSQKRVSELERGELGSMRLDTLSRYAESLGGKLVASIEFPDRTVTLAR